MSGSGIFILVLILAGSVAGFHKEWNCDRARAFNFWLLIGTVVIYFLPNWWLRGLLSIILMRLLVGTGRLENIKKIDDVILLAAVAILLIQTLDVSILPAVLWGIVLAGIWTTLYSLISLWKYDKVTGYALAVPLMPWYHWRFYEYQSAIAAGQGNPNHLHGLCSTAVAAGIGLGLIGQPIGYWLAGVCVIPMAIAQFVRTDNPGTYKRPQQGWAHLLVLGLAWIPILIGPLGWLGAISLTVLVLIVLWRNRHTDTGIDSGRGLLWYKMLRQWWDTGWLNRLLGWGGKSFEQHYIQSVQNSVSPTGQFIIAHHPHSEYVCAMVENGIFGFTCLVGYLLTTLFTLTTLGPTGLAVYGVGVVLCSVAFVSFPWTFYHELLFRVEMNAATPNTPPPTHSRLYTLGTPALFAISFAVFVTVHVILR